MKIAYICLCHTDPEFVARTARTLRYEGDGFFVHVDNKQDEEPFIRACEGLDNVRFVGRRVDNFWGGFNSIIATMNALRLAMDTDSYDRFVLLQGQDYPLVSPREIHEFFSLHADVEFCKARNVSASKNKKDYMRCCGYWLMDMKPSGPMKYLRALLHRFNKLGIRYRTPVFGNGDEVWSVYHGWAQFALTRDCVNYVLDVYENNKSYNDYMRHRFPPDEIYIPTIIHNSHFRDKVSTDVIRLRTGEETMINLTYFEYPVYIIVFKDKEDYEWLKKTGCLFVRKLNSSSIELLCEIDSHIL